MILGNTLQSVIGCGLFVILIKATYRAILNNDTPMIMARLKEKIMTIKEPTTHIICRAKKEMDRPNIMACFLMFRYTSNLFIKQRFLLSK